MLAGVPLPRGLLMEPTPSLARQLWQAVEPLHAVVYFDLPPTDALRELGLRGWWMCYFAGRFAPLGALGPEPATAMAYGFAPWKVARALPDAWAFADPAVVLDVRIGAAAASLRTHLAATWEASVPELADLLTEAALACRYEGRPLAAGWMGVEPGADPWRRLWCAATVLREHRGDGHVLAAVAAGLRGLDAVVTHAATGAVPPEVMRTSRGWTDEEWDQAARRLGSRGLLDRDGRLTRSGGAVRRDVEATTDRLAAGPVERLGETGVQRVIELAAPMSRHLVDTGVVPVPNPIGVRRP